MPRRYFCQVANAAPVDIGAVERLAVADVDVAYRRLIYDDIDFTMVPGNYIFFVCFNGKGAGAVSFALLSRAPVLTLTGGLDRS